MLNVYMMDELIIASMRSFIKVTKRRKNDLAFRGMAEDAAFQKEARLIATEFEASDWEALRLTEKLKASYFTRRGEGIR